MTIPDKLAILSATPMILAEMLEEIPSSMLKQKRIPGKWCIHEHACHLKDAQGMMRNRFQIFKNTPNPVFEPFLPGSDSTPDNHLINMDLDSSVKSFTEDRKELINFLETFTDEDWENEGTHPEYRRYTPAIFLRHIMMHDHLHMYRIEELWLTNDDYLPGR